MNLKQLSQNAVLLRKGSIKEGQMITKDMIKEVRRSYRIGETIELPIQHRERQDKRFTFESFEIISKNARMMTCDNGQYRVSVTYVDLINNFYMNKE